MKNSVTAILGRDRAGPGRGRAKFCQYLHPCCRESRLAMSTDLGEEFISNIAAVLGWLL